jgi:hypothetical protein
MVALLQRCTSGSSLVQRCTDGSPLCRRCTGPCLECPYCVNEESVSVTLSGLTYCGGTCFSGMLGGWQVDLASGAVNGTWDVPCLPESACQYRTVIATARLRHWSSGDGGCTGTLDYDAIENVYLTIAWQMVLYRPKITVTGGPIPTFYGGITGTQYQPCDELAGVAITNTYAACSGFSPYGLAAGGTATVSL